MINWPGQTDVARDHCNRDDTNNVLCLALTLYISTKWGSGSMALYTLTVRHMYLVYIWTKSILVSAVDNRVRQSVGK